MAAVRAFVLLFVLSAVCALQASASPTPAWNLPSLPFFADKNEQASGETKQSQEDNDNEDSNNIITKALEQIKKLIETVKQNIAKAEQEALNALDKIANNAAKSVNDAIKKVTNVDLNLTGNLKDLESKIGDCNSDAQPKLKELLNAIREDAETCASEQVKEAKQLAAELKLLVSIVDTVPEETVADIKECYKKHDADPEHETNPNFFASWGEKVKIAECIAKVLVETAKELKDVPKTVVDIIQQVQSLSSPSSRLTLGKCAVTAVSGQVTNFQKASAELASCVIGPKKNQN